MHPINSVAFVHKILKHATDWEISVNIFSHWLNFLCFIKKKKVEFYISKAFSWEVLLCLWKQLLQCLLWFRCSFGKSEKITRADVIVTPAFSPGSCAVIRLDYLISRRQNRRAPIRLSMSDAAWQRYRVLQHARQAAFPAILTYNQYHGAAESEQTRWQYNNNNINYGWDDSSNGVLLYLPSKKCSTIHSECKFGVKDIVGTSCDCTRTACNNAYK